MHAGAGLIGDSRSKEEKRILLKMSSMAFIEIRAAQFEQTDPAKAFKLIHVVSDVLHNVPGGMACDRPFTEIIDSARLAAKRHGAQKWLDTQLTSARESIG